MEEGQSTGEAAAQGELALDQEQVETSGISILSTELEMKKECPLAKMQPNQVNDLNSCFVWQFVELTDVKVEMALRENSSTTRDETLEPTKHKSTVRHQNCKAALQFLPGGSPGEDDLFLFPESLRAENDQTITQFQLKLISYSFTPFQGSTHLYV